MVKRSNKNKRNSSKYFFLLEFSKDKLFNKTRILFNIFG